MKRKSDYDREFNYWKTEARFWMTVSVILTILYYFK